MKATTKPIVVRKLTAKRCMRTCVYYECSDSQKERLCNCCELYGPRSANRKITK